MTFAGDRIRSGGLGSLPVVGGLAVIWTVFQSLDPVFLSSNNLVNLLFDSSTTGVMALGMVCILMVGEFDPPVGSVSGFASAVVGVLWVDMDWPVAVAILIARGAGALMGAICAVLFNRLGIIVIQSIASGLTLLDLSSSLRYIITGAVLAVAVIVDSLARRSHVSHGRA